MAPPWWRGPWGLGLAAASIVAVVAALVLAGRATSSPSSAASAERPAPASIVAAVTGVSDPVAAAVGDGGVAEPLRPLPPSTPVLRGPDGKPEVLYVGADYCPFCAAERWSLIVALGRFGRFTGLHLTTSASDDVFPDTPTFSFHGSTYSSPYLDFVAVETETRDRQPLESLTPQQQQLFDSYDVPPYAATAGGIPFVDLGNQLVASSSGFSPGLLQGLSWEDVVSRLARADTPQTRAIVGNANWITAALCRLTDARPATVCSAPWLTALQQRLP